MNFCDAMDLLKAGKKLTRNDWRDGLYFVMEAGKVSSYQPVVEHYLYTEDIMVSDGWMVEGAKESQPFCNIIPDLQKGAKAWMADWKPEFYIYLDHKDGLIIHKMSLFSFNPSFVDFQANDWVEV
jgi:hypothetical protein